jgi:hypothetical protein
MGYELRDIKPLFDIIREVIKNKEQAKGHEA